MIINKLNLENIRSFGKEQIVFPDGSTLLSGDIGSGKSTVLMAMDFAFFGLTKSTSGESLLRNGTNSGKVILDFVIDNKKVGIERTLKRTNKGVSQNKGYITIDGFKKEATAIELKQAILDLFQYPSELLTKSKSLIYKYTIYTPQEEMKTILLADTETRIDTLRKIFGIDKYKTIKENVNILVSFIKDNSKEIQGRIFDLPIKESDLQIILEKEDESNKNLIHILVDKKNISFKLEQAKKESEDMERIILDLNDKKQLLQLIEFQIKTKVEDKNVKTEQIQDTEKRIEMIKKEISNLESYDDSLLDNYKKELVSIEQNLNSIFQEKIQITTKIDNAKTIKLKLSMLEECPLCMQKVSHEHKDKIIFEEDDKIQLLQERIDTLTGTQKELQDKINFNKEKIENLERLNHLYTINLIKKENLEEFINQLSKLQSSISEIRKEVGDLSTKKNELQESLQEYELRQNKYNNVKKQIEDYQEQLKNVEIEYMYKNKELELILNQKTILINDVEEKRALQNKYSYYLSIIQWLQEYFITLMDLVEKQIMVKIHADFDTMFQKWFYILIDNEVLKMKLDENFTPLIEQNGHEIDYNYLSGGEKTAAALAYRLALNQVITRLMSKIKTKDLIILDEPTDGFSNEQLDRLRLVLDELDSKQIIIVSHESKIESFMDNIIRLEKQGHLSSVVW